MVPSLYVLVAIAVVAATTIVCTLLLARLRFRQEAEARRAKLGETMGDYGLTLGDEEPETSARARLRAEATRRDALDTVPNLGPPLSKRPPPLH